MIPAEAVEAAWDKLHENPTRPITIQYSELQSALEAAAPHLVADDARKVELSFTRDGVDEEITVASLADLEALCAKHENPLIIKIGKDGRLSTIEVYNDYRE